MNQVLKDLKKIVEPNIEKVETYLQETQHREEERLGTMPELPFEHPEVLRSYGQIGFCEDTLRALSDMVENDELNIDILQELFFMTELKVEEWDTIIEDKENEGLKESVLYDVSLSISKVIKQTAQYLSEIVMRIGEVSQELQGTEYETECDCDGCKENEHHHEHQDCDCNH